MWLFNLDNSGSTVVGLKSFDVTVLCHKMPARKILLQVGSILVKLNYTDLFYSLQGMNCLTAIWLKNFFCHQILCETLVVIYNLRPLVPGGVLWYQL